MSGVTVSTKRNRVYPHKFDHDLARQRREEGWSLGAIAREAGVTHRAVSYVLDPVQRAKMEANRRRYQTSGTCIDCGTRISHNVTVGIKRCRGCQAIHYSTEYTPTARTDALRCCTCLEWKPDADFTTSGTAPLGRRHRQAECKPCAAARRRAARAAAKASA